MPTKPAQTRRRPAASAGGDGQPLVVVESPAKARTIARFLGAGYRVESSIGHIRDLPRRAAEIPAAYKKEPWARLGVDVEHGFAPLYVVTPDKRSQVAKLKSALKHAGALYLATDEDREGEAIAWHLVEVLRPSVPVHRMVFHEITPEAIRAAVRQPRAIDRALVDAQETRRILDRLYGYEVSPVLWKKVMPRLSAGRVQSVATRLLVERERARIRFREAQYWDIQAVFDTGQPADEPQDPTSFAATLAVVDGVRVASGRDFGPDGRLRTADVRSLDQSAAHALADRIRDASFAVRSVEEKPYRRSPYPPFMTSTLQQEANRKLRMTSSRAMQVAQRLYESGYITYMRTDSTTLSDAALGAARQQARELYGDRFVPAEPRRYERRVKNAQEAHEAIRPAGERFQTPAELAGTLSGDEFRLYELIWQRTIASQMSDAEGRSAAVRIGAVSNAGDDVEFSASGRVITFPGFLRAYVEGADDPDAELDDRERRLPPLRVGQPVFASSLEPTEHRTTPPARYTEASLVKALEDLGIGRPSTYASILATIQERGYVFRRGNALVPSFTAFAVIQLLERHFERLVDYGFTAALEDHLDEIANGQQDAERWLTDFYFGPADGDQSPEGLKSMVSERLAEIDARDVNSIRIGADPDGSEIAVRVGRYGPYVQRGADRASVPEDLPPDELTVQQALHLLSKASDERLLGTDPDSGQPVLVRAGRYGPYVAVVAPGEDGAPLKTASLLRSMSMETVTLDDALRLLSLPRTLGEAPDGTEVTAQHGRYGPYVRKGDESRSLDGEDKLFTITLDEALRLFAEPARSRRTPASRALRELGTDPATGRPMQLKTGRFGPYVTDGETNASLRRDDDPEALTPVRAAELLANRRAQGPGRRGGRRRRG